MRVADLLNYVPPSTEREVQDVYKRYGVAIREAVAKAIRLPLSWEIPENAGTFSCSCTVRVDELGFSKTVGRLEIDDTKALAARLQIWLPSLKRFVVASSEMQAMVSELRSYLGGKVDLKGFGSHVGESSKFAATLVQMANTTDLDLAEFVLSVNEDVLGGFFFDPAEGRHEYRRSYGTEIHLYWGAIGLFARLLDLSVDGLTVKVLAHEYAHAYTHLGFDRTGQRWTGHAFSKSDHALKEALAQYWAFVALTRLGNRVPDGLGAYQVLLPKQTCAYRAHLPWLDPYNPDTIASALIRLRPRGALGYEEFNAELARLNNDESDLLPDRS